MMRIINKIAGCCIAALILMNSAVAYAEDWKGLLNYDGSRLQYLTVLLNQADFATVEQILTSPDVEEDPQHRSLYAYLLQTGALSLGKTPDLAMALASRVIEQAPNSVEASLAFLVVARGYAYGLGVEQDIEKAMSVFLEAQQLRLPEAYIQAAIIAAQNPELGYSPEEVRFWLRRGAELGYTDALAVEGVLMLQARLPGTGRDIEEVFRRGIDSGSHVAEYRYGMLLVDGYFGEDRVEEGFAVLESVAAKGYPEANNLLAETILTTQNFSNVDDVKVKGALGMLKLASDKGLLRARMNLGLVHAWGLGVEKSSERAVEFLLSAMDEGYLPAAGALGNLIVTNALGIGSVDEGRSFLAYAAEGGDHLAQYDLGMSYLSGDDMPDEDVIRGLVWLEIAANAEDPEISEIYWTTVADYSAPAVKLSREIAQSCLAVSIKGCSRLIEENLTKIMNRQAE